MNVAGGSSRGVARASRVDMYMGEASGEKRVWYNVLPVLHADRSRAGMEVTHWITCHEA